MVHDDLGQEETRVYATHLGKAGVYLNVWPWSSAPHLGIQAVPAPGVTLANYDNSFLSGSIWNDSWRSFRGPLLHFPLTKIEAAQSLL